MGVLLVGLVSIWMTPGGCGRIRDYRRRKQLEAVAKDWCYTIRASQVIPVYPLTEDLQVGDVFLVHQHAENQHKEYKRRGFLPMEQLLVRLHPEGYHDFYLESHGTRDRNDIPHHWKFPKGAFGSSLGPAAGDKPSDNPPDKWNFGPIAAFPSYGFDIQQGQSFSLSIPVKGVPVAMSLLGAQAAKCSLTIKDAHTYGIDSLQIEKQVRDWAADNLGFLRSFPPEETRKWCMFTNKEQYYVRIVTRVYLAREFNVSVSTADSRGLGLTAGLKMPANMAQPSADAKGKYDTSKMYKDTLEAINTNLEGAPDPTSRPAGPNFGASLRVVAASSRYVSLDEKLPRPVVVGYLAIDLPIMADGKLGRRVSTLGLLETGRQPTAVEYLGPQSRLTASIANDIYRWLKGAPEDSSAVALAKGMGQFAADINIPGDMRFYEIVGNPPKALVNERVNKNRLEKLDLDKKNKTFARFASYSNLLFRSIKALSRCGSPSQAAVLTKQKEMYEDLMQQLRSSEAVKEAHRHYMTQINR
jgi:hypothetical protein